MKFPNISDEEQEEVLKAFSHQKRLVAWVFFAPLVALFLIPLLSNFISIHIGSFLFYGLIIWLFFAGIWAWLYLRCPRCKNLQDHATWANQPLWWAKQGGANLSVRQCVYCGVYLHRKAWEHELWSREWRKNHGNS